MSIPVRAAPFLISAFLILMGAAWIAGNPPGTAADEADHYVKALGAGAGDLDGESPKPGRAEYRTFFGLSARERASLSARFERMRGPRARWQARTSRRFSVPAGLGFSAFGCGLGRPEISASCLHDGRRSVEDTDTTALTGTYQPYVYVLPGVLMRSTREPMTAMRLGRAGIAAISFGLLLLAAFLLWEGGRGALSLAGVLGALTPAVLYFSSSLNASGAEIAAGVCFAASLLRLTRRDEQPGWVWTAVAASGVVLAVSRSLGPAFVSVNAGGVALLVGPRCGWAVLRSAPRRAMAAGAAVALGMIAGLGWQIAAQPRTPGSITEFAREVGPTLSHLWGVYREAVGSFGSLDTPLPLPVPLVWGLLIAALLAGAAGVSGPRRRRSLALLCAGLLTAVIVVLVTSSRTGFQPQGRWVLPLLVLVPLAAGELLFRHQRRLPETRARSLLLGTAAVTAVSHAVAWWTNAHRFATGTDGPWFFIPHAEWTPPGGWPLWTLIGLAGATCCLLAGVAAAGTIASRPTASAAPARVSVPNLR